MQMDKALLEIHGKKQSNYCYELLSNYCEKVFISSRKEQAQIDGRKEFPQIHDFKPYHDIGPLGGILSAMMEYPHADWLVLACDLPFITLEVIEHLIKKRNRKKIVTAYISDHDGLPEPLCAIYEHHSKVPILSFFEKGTICPRDVLKSSNVQLIKQPFRNALENINSPEDFKSVLDEIKDKIK